MLAGPEGKAGIERQGNTPREPRRTQMGATYRKALSDALFGEVCV